MGEHIQEDCFREDSEEWRGFVIGFYTLQETSVDDNNY
jgi:hypothetical protein